LTLDHVLIAFLAAIQSVPDTPRLTSSDTKPSVSLNARETMQALTKVKFSLIKMRIFHSLYVMIVPVKV
jgi:hypothetical protein